MAQKKNSFNNKQWKEGNKKTNDPQNDNRQNLPIEKLKKILELWDWYDS